MSESLNAFLAAEAARRTDPAIDAQLSYGRSPLMVLLLGFATASLYQYYWLIRACTLAEARLERRERQSFLTLLIPIWGYLTYFGALKTIEDRVRATSIRPTAAFWTFGLIGPLLHLSVLAPEPYTCLGLLGPVPVALMHLWLVRAEYADGAGPPQRPSLWEVGMLAIGLPVLGMSMLGFVRLGGAPVVGLVLLGMVSAGVIIHRLGANAVRVAATSR